MAAIEVEIGRRVRQLRCRQDLSVATFAEQVGVCSKTIVNAEAGKPITMSTFLGIAGALGVAPATLLDGELFQRLMVPQ